MDLRIFRIIKQGAKHCGATKYALTDELWALLGLEKPGRPVGDWEVPEDLDEQLVVLFADDPYEAVIAGGQEVVAA